eukprot:7094601-Alexandrium_andersonii.AAC.1
MHEEAKASARVALTHPDPTLSSFAASVAQVAALMGDGPEVETEPEESAAPPTASAEASLESVPEEPASAPSEQPAGGTPAGRPPPGDTFSVTEDSEERAPRVSDLPNLNREWTLLVARFQGHF